MERRTCVARTLAVVGGAFTGRLVVDSRRGPLRPQRVLGVPEMRRKGYPAVDVIAVRSTPARALWRLWLGRCFENELHRSEVEGQRAAFKKFL